MDGWIVALQCRHREVCGVAWCKCVFAKQGAGTSMVLPGRDNCCQLRASCYLLQCCLVRASSAAVLPGALPAVVCCLAAGSMPTVVCCLTAGVTAGVTHSTRTCALS